MLTEELTIDTRGRLVTDITDSVRTFARTGGSDGLLHLFESSNIRANGKDLASK